MSTADDATDGATATDALAGTWTLDPAATTLAFDTKALWFVKVHGTFRAVEGRAELDENGHVRSGRLVFDAASVDTGTAKRDKHLGDDDFFDVERYPTVTFEMTRAESGDGPIDHGPVEVSGTLTIRDQTRPLTFPAAVRRDGDAAIVTATFDLDRRNWGVTWAKMGAGLQNRVTVEARFTRDA